MDGADGDAGREPLDARAEIEELIACVALGDRAAFARLYDRTSAKLFAVCLRVLGDRAGAEDALQEVYVKVWRGAGRYTANGLSPMTWLIAVARHHAIDRLRARGSPGAAPMEAAASIADRAPGPEAQAVAASEAGRIARCLGELDPARADAVRGAYLEGRTYAALAERHGVPINTMRSWMRRSLTKLRECMER